MKCVVIYFSVAGSTAKVAKSIQVGVQGAAGHCDIIKIKDANPRRLYEYDLIGLGAPVFGEVPLNVKNFVNNLRFVGGKHVFAFCTHGTHPELYFPALVPLLKRRGLRVIGTGDWYGSCYLVWQPKPYVTDGHPDEIDLKEAEDFGREMVERSRRISAGETELIPPTPTVPKKEGLMQPGSKSTFHSELNMASKLKYHKEKCLYPKCRICMANCPVDGIDLSVKPPVIANPCTLCELCFNTCPTGAMDGDAWVEMWLVREDVQTKENSKEMNFLLKPLEWAEAEGRFRRLVPLEKVGYDTPLYKTHKKHPRYKIKDGIAYLPE